MDEALARIGELLAEALPPLTQAMALAEKADLHLYAGLAGLTGRLEPLIEGLGERLRQAR